MNHLGENKNRSEEIKQLIKRGKFDTKVNQLAVSIIDLTETEPKIFGTNLDLFIYPASVYKVFIGAEVLRQIEAGLHQLDEMVEIKAPNDIDKDVRLFPDTRPLLKAGDKVSIEYLLELMLGRSDNTASNSLIDLVQRENISKKIFNRQTGIKIYN